MLYEIKGKEEDEEGADKKEDEDEKGSGAGAEDEEEEEEEEDEEDDEDEEEEPAPSGVREGIVLLLVGEYFDIWLRWCGGWGTEKGEMWFVDNKHTTVGVVVVVAFTFVWG